MRTKTAIAIDHIAGTPLCWILNLITRFVGFLLKRNHNPPFQVKKILLVKLMGIGSIVQALPLIDGLSRRYPHCEMRMLCFPETEIFAQRLIPVSAVFTVDRRSLFKLGWTSLREIIAIIRWRPNLVLDLEYHSKFSSLLTTMTCALNRAGFFDVSTRFRDYLYTHLIYANPRRHIEDLYNHLGRVFGVEAFEPLENCSPLVRIDSQDESELGRFLENHSIDSEENLIVINANAGELCLERRWDAQNYATLAAQMAKVGTVLLVGSGSERNYVESLHNMVINDGALKVLNAAGALSFGAYLALLRRAAILITNDSGPMHLAAALGTYVVSLWGPGHPAKHGPRTTKHVQLWENVFCSPCLYITPEPPCRGNNICMKAITVRAVSEAVGKLVPQLSFPIAVETNKLNRVEQAGENLLPGIVLRNHLTPANSSMRKM